MIFKDDALYTGGEVCKTGKIGKSLLDDLVKNKILPVIRISQRIRRFKGSSLNKVFSEK